MSKRILIISLLITCISVAAAYLLLQSQNVYMEENPVGNFLFEETNKQGTDITKIVVKTSDLQVSLYYENKFWHIQEADGYYADLITINKLFQDINQTKIEALSMNVTAKEAGVEQGRNASGTQIQTYNQKGELLDSIIIGKKKNNFWYASRSGSEQIYLISGNFDLPDSMNYWLQQPLISLLPENVESLLIQSSTGQQLAYRLAEKSQFLNLKQQPVNVIPLLDKFVLFTYKDVKKIQNTPLDSLKPQKIIILFPYSGLIYGIEVFQIEGEYWIKVDLSITKLPTKLASDYIKDSLFLYEGWAFKVDKKLGKYLNEFKIN